MHPMALFIFKISRKNPLNLGVVGDVVAVAVAAVNSMLRLLLFLQAVWRNLLVGG